MRGSLPGTRKSDSSLEDIVSGPKPDNQDPPTDTFPEPAVPLKIKEIQRGHSRTVHLAGELDLMSAELLESTMRRLASDASDELIVLDLSDVSFMDSTGLRAVLVGIALCVEQNRELELLPGPAEVQRLFEISGLVDDIPFAEPNDDRNG